MNYREIQEKKQYLNKIRQYPIEGVLLHHSFAALPMIQISLESSCQKDKLV